MEVRYQMTFFGIQKASFDFVIDVRWAVNQLQLHLSTSTENEVGNFRNILDVQFPHLQRWEYSVWDALINGHHLESDKLVHDHWPHLFRDEVKLEAEIEASPKKRRSSINDFFRNVKEDEKEVDDPMANVAEALSLRDVLPASNQAQCLMEKTLVRNWPLLNQEKLEGLPIVYEHFERYDEIPEMVGSLTRDSFGHRLLMTEVAPFFARMSNCDKFNIFEAKTKQR